MNNVERRLAKKIEDLCFEVMMGGKTQKRRQTAIRVNGNGFETVELDDDGKVIEPIRCTCGSYAVMHSPQCPFAYAVT